MTTRRSIGILDSRCRDVLIARKRLTFSLNGVYSPLKANATTPCSFGERARFRSVRGFSNTANNTVRQDYWLYAVSNCATPSPRFTRVQDPLGNLLAKAKGSVLVPHSQVAEAGGG